MTDQDNKLGVGFAAAAFAVDLLQVGKLAQGFDRTASHWHRQCPRTRSAAFDIYAACSGFLYGMSVANAFIKSEAYKNVLLIGAEVLSRFTDWEDRTTCILFGDGAGAVVLQRHAGKHGILSTHLHSEGSLGDMIHVPGGGAQHPASSIRSENGCIS